MEGDFSGNPQKAIGRIILFFKMKTERFISLPGEPVFNCRAIYWNGLSITLCHWLYLCDGDLPRLKCLQHRVMKNIECILCLYMPFLLFGNID